jgi:hypothetical protein
VTRPAAGDRFGLLVVLDTEKRRTWDGAPRLYLHCRCDCGELRSLWASYVTRASKPTRSCGCLNRAPECRQTHGGCRRTEKRPEYGCWTSLRHRCRNPRHSSWPLYGGRGIKVCSRWDSFEAFLSDMGPRPSPEHSVDRIDSDGDYEPSNCRWATRCEQGFNQRQRVSGAGYRGVRRSGAGWAGYVYERRRAIYCGTHPTPELAARARDRVCIERGLPARLNFPTTPATAGSTPRE